ncbi:arylsulfatase b-like [Plakobranchus ocellatus]|uniref:Arylsulfatase b-like n=1 Tax=Plakobranchus ocellatus TaxID=259542 RepID=A0AAV4C4H5_9GAST|nr:arylsulfatase b-like [Plakobranchus ocellatus]
MLSNQTQGHLPTRSGHQSQASAVLDTWPDSPVCQSSMVIFIWGVGGTVDSESAIRSGVTLLSRVRAPPPAPWPDEGPESLRSPKSRPLILKKIVPRSHAGYLFSISLIKSMRLQAAAIILMVVLKLGHTEGRTQPNIVVILSDDQGYHDIGYHSPNIFTPTLDQLAAEGVKLENYYVQPACSPSRSQLMTGRYQIHLGLQHRVIRPSQPYGVPLQHPTIADILRQGGYSTHAVGKWHLGFYRKEYTPLYRGFDTFYGFLGGAADHYNYIGCDFKANGLNGLNLGTVERWCSNSLLDMEEPVGDQNGTYSTHLYTDKAIDIVVNASRSDKPLFLYLSYPAPHSPLQSPEKYYQNLTHIVNKKRRIYTGMLAALDEGVKNLTDALKDYGLWNNTVLIYSSDNGGDPAWGGINLPLRGYKGTLWEGGVRSIGFVSSPLLSPKQRGEVSHGLMHISDWFPTIADMAGVTVNSSLGVDGVSQWHMIRDGEPSNRTELIHNIDILQPLRGDMAYQDTFDTRVRAAIRVGNYKLLTGDPGDGKTYAVPGRKDHPRRPFASYSDGTDKNVWLYDVVSDPEEKTDLSASMPDLVRELLDKLSVYNSTALPPTFPAPDPNCDPELNGNIWQPWIHS